MLFMAMLAVASGAVITRPVANMYSAPSEDKDVVSQAVYGSNVRVVEDKGDWLNIRTADDYTGWVPAGSLLRGIEYARRGKVAEVQSLLAHLYRDPSVTKHAPLLTVPFESRLEVVEDSGHDERWLQVRLPDDRPAWVQRGDVEFDLKPLTVPVKTVV